MLLLTYVLTVWIRTKMGPVCIYEIISNNFLYFTTYRTILYCALYFRSLRFSRPTRRSNGKLVLLFKLHRRLTFEDRLGVSEVLDEKQYGQPMVSRGKHVLHFDDLENAARAHRLSALDVAMQPIVTFAPTSMSSSEWYSAFNATVRYARRAPTVW